SDRGRERERADEAEEQRVAVGRGLGDEVRRGDARGAGTVLDERLLREALGISRAGREKRQQRERRGREQLLHGASSLDRIISQPRAGVSGSSRGRTPRGPSAAASAFATTPPTGMMPPSPAPFAPSGLSGDGCSSSANTRMCGKSCATGIE